MSVNEHILQRSGLVELDRLDISNELNTSLDSAKHDSSMPSQHLHNINVYDDPASKSKKFNSLPMRIKKSTNVKLKAEPKSSSAINYGKAEDYVVLSEEELAHIVKLACTRMQENAKLKQLLRNNYWPYNHPMRNYLWKCLLKQAGSTSVHIKNSGSAQFLADKENSVKNEVYCNESDYNKHLNHIFGKCMHFFFNVVVTKCDKFCTFLF